MVAINSYKLLPSVTTIAVIHYMQFVFDALMTASDKTTFASIKVADVGDAVGWHWRVRLGQSQECSAYRDPCRPARSNSSSCTTLSVDRPKEQPRCTYPLRDVREIMYLMFFRDSHGYFFCRSSIFHPLCILFDKERRHFVIVYRAEWPVNLLTIENGIGRTCMSSCHCM